MIRLVIWSLIENNVMCDNNNLNKNADDKYKQEQHSNNDMCFIIIITIR